MRGSATASIGAIASAAASSEASTHHTIPHTLRRWISSGKGGAGGTVWNAKKAQTLRGAEGSHSRYAAKSSSASSNA
jgi:hypothetical protein